MKFTKQQAYENIVANLTKNGEKLSLSERSINEQLDTLMSVGANEETELDAFVSSFLPLFVTANANVRNDVSVGINKYKEEHPEPKPNPNPVPQVGNQQQSQGSSDLEQRLAEMEAWKAAQESANKVSAVKENLRNALKAKGVKNSEWIESMLGVVNISEDCDVNAQADSWLGLYNKFVASVDPSQVPLGGAGGTSQQNLKNVIEEAAAYAKGNNMSY